MFSEELNGDRLDTDYRVIMHGVRVGLLAQELASSFGMSKQDVERCFLAGLLHDSGKLLVPQAILNKPGKLDQEETSKIQEHPLLFMNVINQQKVHIDQQVVFGVLYHHEREDGDGYYKIKPNNIARIVHIVDVFDSLTTPRCYRHNEKYTTKQALKKIDDDKGSFNPDMLIVFKKMITKNTVDELLSMYQSDKYLA